MASNSEVRIAFRQCMDRALLLVSQNLKEHLDDMSEIFMRDGSLAASMPLKLTTDQSGRLKIDIGIDYVKERVKYTNSTIITPGQGSLPGVSSGGGK